MKKKTKKAKKTKKESKSVRPVSRESSEKAKVLIIPGITESYAYIPIIGANALVMDRKSPRVIRDIRHKQINKDNTDFEFTKLPAPPPPILFQEAIYQHTNGEKPTKHKIIAPYTLREKKKPETFSVSIKAAFPSIAVKKSMVRLAKTLADRGIVAKGLSLKIKEGLHIHGKVFPIEFERLTMEEIPMGVNYGNTVIKWLPHFHGWSAWPLISWCSPIIDFKMVCTLINNCGITVGLGALRREKGGNNGTFVLGDEKPVASDYFDAVAYNEDYTELRENV